MKYFKKPSKEFWRALVLSAVVGMAAGALGTVAVWSSLLAYQTNLVTPNATTSATNRRRVAIAEEELLQKTREDIPLSVADIFIAKADPEARYLPGDAIAHGVVLSTDGWIVTHRSAVDPKRKATLRVGAGTVLLTVDQIIEDTETGILFLKIKTNNLHAAIFGVSSDLLAGDRLLSVDGNRHLRIERVDVTHLRATTSATSDLLESRLSMVPNVPSLFAGTPILNTQDEVVGIATVDASGQISTGVPSDQIVSLFAGLFAKEKLTRPALGIRGIHLEGSRTVQGRERGFLITGLERGSSAEHAGLHTGDVVLKLGTDVLNEGQDIAELLLAHKPAEEVDLTIVRGGKEQTLSVTLGTRESGKLY